MNAQAVERDLLRVEEVAARLRCRPETARRMVRRDLPAVRLGSSERSPIRVRAGEPQHWLFDAPPAGATIGVRISSPRSGLEGHEA